MTPNNTNNRIRILIVDDEESLRMVISQVLSEDGFDVTAAASGEETRLCNWWTSARASPMFLG